MPGPADLTAEAGFAQAATAWAEAAVERVRRLAAGREAASADKLRREFLALTRELPSRVHATGLVRALVELASRGAESGAIKADTTAGVLLDGCLRWLAREGGPFPRRDGHGYVSPALFALEEAIYADPEWAACAQEDLQRYLGWVKRLAESDAIFGVRPGPSQTREGGRS